MPRPRLINVNDVIQQMFLYDLPDLEKKGIGRDEPYYSFELLLARLRTWPKYSQWTPASEPPKAYGDYLVHFDDGDNEYVTHAVWDKDGWSILSGTIIAWTRYPVPWEEI